MFKTKKQRNIDTPNETGALSSSFIQGHKTYVKVVRWNDNNKINIMGTFRSACPTGNIRRWDGLQNPVVHEKIDCPAQIMMYNKNMGGVDKMDSLISFYCMFFRSKKLYHRVFFHYIDICIVNAWLLYVS